MLYIKNERELGVMAEAGRRLAEVHAAVGRAVRAGATPLELDALARSEIEARGAEATQVGYRGYPAAICVSINEVVIHGIPVGTPIADGDVVSVDFALTFEGMIVDMARTYAVGTVSDEARRLIRVTEESFWKGLEWVRPGKRVGDVSGAIQRHVEAAGYWCLREFTGHGVGLEFHEQPDVPNFGTPGKGRRLKAGMTIAVEPMVSLYRATTKTLEDGWTATMGSPDNLAAHYENTVAVTEDGPRVLTRDSS